MVKNIEGQKFGRLTAVSLAEICPRSQARWNVKCDCGREKVVWSKHIISGRIQSCGCLLTDTLSARAVDVNKRFDEKWVPEPNTGCWLWTANALPDGYGLFWHKKTMYHAHRFSYERQYRMEIPTGLLACHKCDTPPCVNPHHIFLGTHKDNGEDKARKGRSTKGRKRTW